MNWEYYEDQKEGIILNLIKTLEEYGIVITEANIFWTGFGSQGDGLVFDFERMDVLKFISKKLALDPLYGYGFSFNLFLLALKNDLIQIDISTSRNNFSTLYNHEKTRVIELDYTIDDTLLKLDNEKSWDIIIKNEFKNIEQFRIDICTETYKELQTTYGDAQNMSEEDDDDDNYYGLDPKDEEEIDPLVYIHYKTNKEYIIIQDNDLQIQVDNKWVDAISYKAINYHKTFVRSKEEFFQKFKLKE